MTDQRHDPDTGLMITRMITVNKTSIDVRSLSSPSTIAPPNRMEQRHHRNALNLGCRDRFLDVAHGMSGEIFRNLSAENIDEFFMVTLAKLAERPRRRNDNQI
ncbi:hypothetical protein GJW-30_1_02039 [Variibacter gotjawalensis]|uniref:Uncharacterized protein n=1 Tax=Variibacter gotjawalensis TaxID=1333996 RepID=A0A0S3PUD9_9BRAD|nr:hypothetical protein GJW-30_1_02039 [Variibacter gotjawalensis]